MTWSFRLFNLVDEFASELKGQVLLSDVPNDVKRSALGSIEYGLEYIEEGLVHIERAEYRPDQTEKNTP